MIQTTPTTEKAESSQNASTKFQSEIRNINIAYVRSVLSGRTASCVCDGDLEPPAGAKCRTRSGFRSWLRRNVKLTIPSRECPLCGAEVSRRQKRCGDCGARLTSFAGWGE